MGEEQVVPEDLEQRIIEMVAEERNLPVDRVSVDSSLEELGFDSLDGMNVSFNIEEAFDIEIPDDVMDQLETVGDIVHGVRRILEQRPG